MLRNLTTTVVIVLAIVVSAFAVDTWETAGLGFSYFEADLAGGFASDGSGSDPSYDISLLLGAGILQNLTLWAMPGISDYGTLSTAFSFMYTPVSGLIDLDLFANYAYSGGSLSIDNSSEHGLGAMVECNVNLETMGFWLDLGADYPLIDDASLSGYSTLGIQFFMPGSIELLLAGSSGFADAVVPSFSVDLGCNFGVRENAEVISAVGYDITGESVNILLAMDVAI